MDFVQAHFLTNLHIEVLVILNDIWHCVLDLGSTVTMVSKHLEHLIVALLPWQLMLV